MPEGIYAAAAGMAADQARLDAVANDLANVNTDGYKKQRLGFRDLVYGQRGTKVWIGSGAAAVDAGRDFSAGALRQTDSPLDLAIDGPGFFRVKRADGSIALTRAGSFRLDGSGRFVTANGELLDPPLTLPKGASAADVTVAADGTVTVKGTKLGQLQTVDVPAPAGLQPVGDSLYVATAASGAAAPDASTVQQGVLEASNVDVAQAMTDLIDAQRSYSLASRVIQTQDQMLQIADDIRR